MERSPHLVVFLLRFMELLIFHESCFQPFPYEFQHSSVTDSSFHKLHQFLMINIVKVPCDIDIYYPVTFFTRFPYLRSLDLHFVLVEIQTSILENPLQRLVQSPISLPFARPDLLSLEYQVIFVFRPFWIYFFVRLADGRIYFSILYRFH